MSTAVPSGAVLVVVDLQLGFLNEHTSPVTSPVGRLAAQWSQSGRAVVASRFLNQPDSPWERLLGWTRLQTPPDTDLHPAVAAVDPVIVDKTAYSALVPELLSLLADLECRDLYFCGVDTDACVLASAVDAFDHGFDPRVVQDLAASGAGEGFHEAGLLLLRRFIGEDRLVDSSDLAL